MDCSKFLAAFMALAVIISTLNTLGRIGNVLIMLRCIEVRDKDLSMAFNVVFMSLFAMLPSPIVYGAIIDNTCILW